MKLTRTRETERLWLASRYRGDAGGADEGGDEEAERDEGEAPTDKSVDRRTCMKALQRCSFAR